MANVTSYRDDESPVINTGISVIHKAYALASDAANNGDTIELYTVPIGSKKLITGVDLRTSATLGASATAQVRVNRGGTHTVLTAATTAGAASKVGSSAQAGVPFEAEGGDIIELLIGGADISAAATATVDIYAADRE